MSKKTYAGSCHCGAVRFEADIDLAKGVNKCNCSVCTKARAWFAIAAPDDVRVLKGEAAQTVYEWTSAAHPRPNLHFQFCKTCGIRTFGRGDRLPGGGPFCFVNIAALDGVDADELAGAPTNIMDGRHDRYDRRPDDTRGL